MYLGLRIAGLKTQLQLNELARGTTGHGERSWGLGRRSRRRTKLHRVTESSWSRLGNKAAATLSQRTLLLRGYQILDRKITGIDFPLAAPRSARSRGIDRARSSCRRFPWSIREYLSLASNVSRVSVLQFLGSSRWTEFSSVNHRAFPCELNFPEWTDLSTLNWILYGGTSSPRWTEFSTMNRVLYGKASSLYRTEHSAVNRALHIELNSAQWTEFSAGNRRLHGSAGF